jgi:Tfp pilus assembly protein PilF
MDKMNIKRKNNYANYWIPILVIIGIVFGIYAQSLKFDFIYFDENSILLQNKDFFTADFSFKKAFTTDAFTHCESPYYRPLQNLSFAMDTHIAGGIIPWSFHLTNLILYLLVGFLLYFFLVKLNINLHFALLGTLLFVANPLNVWSAVWVPSRGDLLLTLFTLLSFIYFINFVKKNRFIDKILTFLFFTLALFSKETAVFIPFLFLLYFLFEVNAESEMQKEKKWKILLKKMNYKYFLLAVIILSIGILWIYLRKNAVFYFENVFYWNDVFYNLINIPVAVSQIVFPYEMSPFPKFSITKIVLGSFVLAFLFFIILKKTETSKGKKLFFLLWFILFLLPTLFVRGIHVDYFEHRYLLPQIGVLVLIIEIVIIPVVSSFRFRVSGFEFRCVYLFLCMVVLIFGITSFVKARTLKDSITVIEAVEKYNGIAVNPYLNRGAYYIAIEKYEEAEKDMRKVIQIDKKNYIALNNLGKISMFFQEYENAIAFYNISLSINKEEAAYYNRSLAKTFLGEIESALLDLDSAILLKKNIPLLYNNRGVIKMNLGLTKEALEDFSNAIKYSNSTYSDAFANRAFVHLQLGNRNEALLDCNKALQLEPESDELRVFKISILNDN